MLVDLGHTSKSWGSTSLIGSSPSNQINTYISSISISDKVEHIFKACDPNRLVTPKYTPIDP